jgi:deazaflavin-dependent oxidoreductase (nitroreductase family)
MVTSEVKEALDKSKEIELSVIGRKSGKKISRPVWLVYNSNKLYLLPLNGSETNWYKNIHKNPMIKISIDNMELSANARPVIDSSRVKEIVDAFSTKYGENDVKKYYSKLDAIVEFPFPNFTTSLSPVVNII